MRYSREEKERKRKIYRYVRPGCRSNQSHVVDNIGILCSQIFNWKNYNFPQMIDIFMKINGEKKKTTKSTQLTK